jgi:hypothetical protein
VGDILNSSHTKILWQRIQVWNKFVLILFLQKRIIYPPFIPVHLLKKGATNLCQKKIWKRRRAAIHWNRERNKVPIQPLHLPYGDQRPSKRGRPKTLEQDYNTAQHMTRPKPKPSSLVEPPRPRPCNFLAPAIHHRPWSSLSIPMIELMEGEAPLKTLEFLCFQRHQETRMIRNLFPS